KANDNPGPSSTSDGHPPALPSSKIATAAPTENKRSTMGLLMDRIMSVIPSVLQDKVEDEFSIFDSQENCPICVNEIKPRQIIRQLPCLHVFHLDCIDDWLTEKSSICPMCKLNI
ncbi:hypothetical protein BJ085DRAFT_5766, partial [Dimargaris cristalligena]